MMICYKSIAICALCKKEDMEEFSFIITHKTIPTSYTSAHLLEVHSTVEPTKIHTVPFTQFWAPCLHCRKSR